MTTNTETEARRSFRLFLERSAARAAAGDLAAARTEADRAVAVALERLRHAEAALSDLVHSLRWSDPDLQPRARLLVACWEMKHERACTRWQTLDQQLRSARRSA